MAQIKLTETVLQQGYYAHTTQGLAREEMLPILHQLDNAGYEAVSVWGSKEYEQSLTTWLQDPWDRLRMIRQEMPITKLVVSVAGQCLVGKQPVADDVVTLFVQRGAAIGIDIFRVYDPLNSIFNVEQVIKVAKREKKQVQGGICYGTGGVHDTKLMTAYARQLASEGADSLILLDEAGQLTPYMAYDIVRDLRMASGLPVEIHTRNTRQMASMVYLKAAEAGVTGIDTVLQPFAGGVSLPATQSMVLAFENTPYHTLFDTKAVELASDYFATLKEEKDFLADMPPQFASTLKAHQLSTTVAVELLERLQEANQQDKLDQVFEELAYLRQYAGQAILVSPVADFFVKQALLTVAEQERFKTILPDFANYIRGQYGRPPAMVDVALRQQVIGEELPDTGRSGDRLPPALERLKEELPAEQMLQQEDLLTLAQYPAQAPAFFKTRYRQVMAEQEIEKKSKP